MPSVAIEQNLESRQTYLRLRGVGRLLNQPQYSIGGDSNEMLGPHGWKNQVIVNQSPQCLDGDDLLLELDPRLVNHIEPGRAIEIQVEELGFAQRIQPPPLMVFPSTSSPLPPGVKPIIFTSGGGQIRPAPAQPKRGAVEPRPPQFDDEQPTQPAHGSGTDQRPADPAREIIDEDEGDRDDDRERLTRRIDQDDVEPPEEREADGTRPVPEHVMDDIREPDVVLAPEDKGKDDPDSGEDEPEPLPRRNWWALIAAVLVGLILGFSAKYIADEYSPWSNPTALGPAKRKIELVQTDAFGPLAEDLKVLPEKSPLGLGPDDLPDMKPLTINRGKSFFNYGAGKLAVNRAEATYWFKRSVKMIEPDALAYLGDGYLHGDGVPRDARTGYQLIRLGAALGSETARNYLVEQLTSGKIPNAPATMGEAFRPR